MEATGRLVPRPRAAGAGSRPFRGLIRAQATTSGQATGDRSIPPWAGDGALSRTLNLAIRSPLFGPMQFFAKAVVTATAEKKGVPWKRRYKDLEASEVYEIFPDIEDPSIEYPSYYTKQFHAYKEGNLNWKAAFEVESATNVMCLRTWKNEDITPEVAADRMKNNIACTLLEYSRSAPSRGIKDVLDVGCAVGVSTRWLAETFPSASCTGLDLSPYFLSVAELCERQAADQQQRCRIRYIHGKAESTGLPSNSYDLVNVQYVVHECPAEATVNIIREAWRLLRPGGMLAVIDQDPRSRTLQNLPPLLFTLLKSTEPWTDQYLTMNMEGALQAEGFEAVAYVPIDHRHRSVMGIKK